MLAVLATYGTTGDVQPLLGLAAELSRRGHIVKFAAPPEFGPRVSGLGFDFVSLGPPMDMADRSVYGRATSAGDPLQSIQQTLPLVIRDTPRMVEELAGATEGADVLISLPYQLAGRIVHELKDIPLVVVFLSPFGGFGRGFSGASSRLVNELRAQYGLKEITDPFGPAGSPTHLGLCAVSSELFRRPRHWPERHRITGFFFFDEDRPVDPDLERFVESGEPPIVVSFGSVIHESPEHLAEIVSKAIQKAGKRAVVQQGWTGLKFQSLLPKTVHAADFVPHRWLFSRAACVVHAGGAGTTAATLRAGIPSVVVPHVLDQFLWATLLRERGCASDVIPYGELTAERLGIAIELACTPTSQKAAALFPEIINREGGASLAADIIESQYSSKAGH
jgi:sterol 3beta-glucosyltransferase